MMSNKGKLISIGQIIILFMITILSLLLLYSVIKFILFEMNNFYFFSIFFIVLLLITVMIYIYSLNTELKKNFFLVILVSTLTLYIFEIYFAYAPSSIWVIENHAEKRRLDESRKGRCSAWRTTSRTRTISSTFNYHATVIPAQIT